MRLIAGKYGALIPLFIGFMGMYCFTEERPANLIIASSTATSL